MIDPWQTKSIAPELLDRYVNTIATIGAALPVLDIVSHFT